MRASLFFPSAILIIIIPICTLLLACQHHRMAITIVIVNVILKVILIVNAIFKVIVIVCVIFKVIIR